MNLKTENQKYSHRSGGYIAFMSILVVSAVALAISLSISLLGVGEAKNSLDFKKGQETQKIAESCVEEALIRLRDDSIYLGGSLNVGNGLCTINISGTGINRQIDVVGQIDGTPGYFKQIEVNVEILGNSINVLNWSEI
jgi:hypothetical protein